MKYEVQGHIDFTVEIEAATEVEATEAAELLEVRIPAFPEELSLVSVELIDHNTEIDEGPDPIED